MRLESLSLSTFKGGSPSSPPILIFTDDRGRLFERHLCDVLTDLRRADARSIARGDSFSRVCGGCGVEHPLRRAVSTECGHAVCRSCAIGVDECAVCERHTTRFVALLEPVDFSRHCRVCNNEAPLQRALLSSCGHILCCGCALQLIPEALSEDAVFCPFCSADSEIVFIVEDVIKPNYLTRFLRFVIRIVRNFIPCQSQKHRKRK